jgi:hypothetical protein
MIKYEYKYTQGELMFYKIFEEYCSIIMDCEAWHFLDITQQSWCRIKRTNSLNLNQYKKICSMMGYHITDDHEELSKLLVEKYYGAR